MNPESEKNLYQPAESNDNPESTSNQQSISWTTSEYIEHQRGLSWYLLLVLITAVLATVIYFIANKDLFAAGTIVVLGLIVGAFAGRKPSQITVELSVGGINVGQRSYGYNLFKSFSILHDGSLTSLNLTSVKRFMPPVSAYFDPKDEKRITNLLGEHLPFEERKASAIDRLSFRLRI